MRPRGDSGSRRKTSPTIFHPATAFSSIDRRFANTLADLTNNLLVKTTVRDGAGGTAANNVEGATAALFADAAKGDLHLVNGTTSARRTSARTSVGSISSLAGLSVTNVSPIA